MNHLSLFWRIYIVLFGKPKADTSQDSEQDYHKSCPRCDLEVRTYHNWFKEVVYVKCCYCSYEYTNSQPIQGDYVDNNELPPWAIGLI